MTETDACRVLLVRAFEAPLQPPWTSADRDAVDLETARSLGVSAPPEQLIAHRATLAVQRLSLREPAVDALLGAVQAPRWIVAALLGAAFVAGATLDALTSAQRIDLLAPPLLGVLAWNLIVYLLLAGRAVIGRGGVTPWRRTLSSAVWRLATRTLPKVSRASPPLARFTADWIDASAPLQAARAAALLHAAAAAFAVGALAALYLRGLGFELRAGWQSTFLDADAVHRLLTIVLAPAAHLVGLALPGTDDIARLRWPPGRGENAALWIHLYAITIGMLVVLPRLALAEGARRRARRLAEDFTLPLSEPYFQRLLPREAGARLDVQVLPFNLHGAADLQAGLAEVLGETLGLAVRPVVTATIVEGEEHRPGPMAAAPALPVSVALFAATATPERETHAAFVRRLQARAGAGVRVLALVDESGFRRRFTGLEGEKRLQQRREAWRRLLDECGCQVVFADLSQAHRTID